jgi:hypothetical protein
MLIYRGLGSGITRALHEWPAIDFIDDRDGCLFKAIVHRKETDGIVLPTVSGKTSGKTSGKIMEASERRYTETYWPSQMRALAGFLTISAERKNKF